MRGKEIRLERIMDRNTGKTIIVPMDHGVTSGPMKGLTDVSRTVEPVAEGGANVVLGHLGRTEPVRPGSSGHRTRETKC